jgi:sugar lactone lactonase YvrE
MRTRNYWLPAVLRMPFEGEGGPQLFAGHLETKEEGSDNSRFTVPTSVACDARGRVYIADYMNDRIQVYRPDGTFHRTVPVRKPAQIVVHQRTGEIYVFSWAVGNWRLQASRKRVKAQLTRLGPLEEPGKAAQYDLPLIGYRGRVGPWTKGQDYTAEVDSWAEEPTIWLYRGGYGRITWGGHYAGHAEGRRYWRPAGIQLLGIQGDKLVVRRDLGEEAARAVLKSNRVAGTNRNLCVDHRTGTLYVGDGSAGEGFSWSLAVAIDPETGRCRLVDLPFDAEQMAFDQNGLAYLRARGYFVRYDPTSWREVPWDYGEEHEKIATASSGASGPGFKPAGRVASALVVPCWEHAPNGVFSISPKGHIVVPIKGRQASGVVLRKTEEVHIHKADPYRLRLYPGRSVSGLVLVLDQHGRMVYDDAIPGLTYTHGVKIDRNDNLYAMALANRVLDGEPYFNPAACTLMKFRPKKGRICGTHKKAVPVPMTGEQMPKRPPDLLGGGKTGLRKAWVEGAEWFYGGVGYNGEHHRNPDYGCDCCFSSFDLDYFARSFVPEVDHYSVAVLDTNGNLILRMGRYGNVDDGVPLIQAGGPSRPRSLGGDEVALFHAPHLATHTDRRLFIADVGNERIVSVKLDYHKTERVALSDAPAAPPQDAPGGGIRMQESGK